MIVDSFSGFLAFLTLVAPGLVYQLVVELRLPHLKQTVFREASKIALASLVFSLPTLLIISSLQFVIPSIIPNLGEWIRVGNAYLAANFQQVVVGVTLQAVLSVAFAGVGAMVVTRRVRATLTDKTALYTIMRAECPPDAIPWIHLKLSDGTEFWGHVRYYTPDQSSPCEIVLGGQEMLRKDVNGNPNLIGNDWDAVWLKIDDVVYMQTIYLDGSRKLRRLLPDEHGMGPAKDHNILRGFRFPAFRPKRAVPRNP